MIGTNSPLWLFSGTEVTNESEKPGFEGLELLAEDAPNVENKAGGLAQYFGDRDRLLGCPRLLEFPKSLALAEHIKEGDQMIPQLQMSLFHWPYPFLTVHQLGHARGLRRGQGAP